MGGGGARPGLRLLAPSDLPSSLTPGLGTLGRVSAVGLQEAPPADSRWPGCPGCGGGVLPAVGAGGAPGPWPGRRSSLECCRCRALAHAPGPQGRRSGNL